MIFFISLIAKLQNTLSSLSGFYIFWWFPLLWQFKPQFMMTVTVSILICISRPDFSSDIFSGMLTDTSHLARVSPHKRSLVPSTWCSDIPMHIWVLNWDWGLQMTSSYIPDCSNVWNLKRQKSGGGGAGNGEHGGNWWLDESSLFSLFFCCSSTTVFIATPHHSHPP